MDFRLRPDGRHAPICRSLEEYLSYYEARGENWERQMLLKADYLSGSKSLFEKFIDYLTPFIYPSASSNSPNDQILQMKSDIERKNNERENIKLLSGGIRDIEFAIQALQLINGGKIKEIRSSNTLNALKLLYKARLLDRNEKLILTNAYIFYRQLEHYLQLMNDRQTHVIPEEGELLEKLSYYMRFHSIKKFKQQIIDTREQVRKIYDSILIGDEITESKNNILDRIKFKDIIRAGNDIQFLRDGRGITGNRTFDAKSIESFLKIERDIIEYLIKSTEPDKVLSNFVRVIKKSSFPSIWYSELLDKTFLKYLLNVCEYSQYSVDLFAEDEGLRDFLLSRKVFMKIPKNELSNLETKFLLFYFSVQITVGFVDPVTASQNLSDVIKSKLNRIIKNYSDQFEWNKDYFVAVLGSLGSSTITFYSDFDILFIVRNTKNYLDIEKGFQELLSVIKSKLYPFTIDCRLRPEGESSQLVWDVKNANEYFNKRARVWEYQAVTKLNFITGNKRLFNSFTKLVIMSSAKFDKNEIRMETIKMRNKLLVKRSAGLIDFYDVKKNAGTLNDIDFTIQYFIICDLELFSQSVGTPMVNSFELLSKKLKKRDIKILNDAFVFFKSIEMYNQLINNVSVSKIDLAGEKTNIFSEKISSGNVRDFKSMLKRYSSEVKNLYLQTIN
jgi:glutamate-ammonia-ligase adenylyltransferase